MIKETPPKAEITLDTTRDEYVSASLLAARRNGSLRKLPWMIVLSSVLLLLGLCSIERVRGVSLSLLLSLLLCLSCPLLLAACLWIEPRAIKRRSARYYNSYQQLMQSTTLKLYADNAITQTSSLKLTDEYALMAECIETPELFVFLKDHERLLILPKRCLPGEQAAEITSFLRLVFARRRHAMKNWIF